MRAGFEPTNLCEFINTAVKHHGTHKAHVNLINGKADLILVARMPSDDELRVAEEQHVQLVVEPVALDAFVFLLNGKNPVGSLSAEEIRDIYSGRIANWQEVGGATARIQPYQRNRNSGSQELMRRLVMKERKMIEAPDMLIGTLMSHPFLALDDDVHGIGYSVYFYHEFMSPPARIKACAVDGILPSPHNIRSRRYPFVSEVYVAARNDLSADATASRLRSWLLAATGQQVVQLSGYVPISNLIDEPPGE